jgi:hypothetical protein
MERAIGDPLPPHAGVIEVRVTELRQLFNAIDPSPFHEKDLDPNAEEFILEWAKEFPAHAHLALVVHIAGPPGPDDEAALLRSAVEDHFRRRAETTRRRLRALLRNGRVSLLIGATFLAVSLFAAQLLVRALEGQRLGEILRESLLIAGWVAMWRPIQVLLYDWWPIRSEARLFDRLKAMPVRIVYIDR